MTSPPKAYPLAKLTEEEVREIRKTYRMAHRIRKKRGLKLLRAGLAADLAAKYGVSARAIQHIQTGDRWRGLK